MIAKFEQNRNDLYWTIYDLADGSIRWIGYNDDFWWNNVSKSDQARNQTGKVTGRVYRLDHSTNEVEIMEASNVEA